MILCFSVLEKLVFDFLVIREICIYLHVIYGPTIILYFLEMLASLKLVNYIKLDEKAAHSTRLRIETLTELTTATVKQKGLESAIRDKSLGTNLHF